MKKVTIIFLLIAIQGEFFGQSYHKLIRQNTYWDVLWRSNNPICYSSADRIFFTGSDTTIDGHQYQISRQYDFQSINPGPLCPPFEILNQSYSTQKFLREDTVARKVYIYCTDCTPPRDDLFYDFSIHVGDTLQSWYASYSSQPLVCGMIRDIQLANGEIRKEYLLKKFEALEYSYIEGIGGNNGLLLPLESPEGASGGYFCVQDNGTNLYGSDCNNFFVGIDNTDHSSSISPNPAHESFQINVDFSDSEMIFKLFDVNGKEVLHKTITQKVTTIPINDVPPGMYLFSIISNTFNKPGKICIL